MNERIKELWKKSQQWNGSDDGSGGLKIHESVEKFAELIIRECAGVGYDASYYECALNVSNKIKEHFGVEE